MWKKYKAKIIFAVIAAALLTGAFVWGGNYSKNTSQVTPPTALTTNSPEVTASVVPAVSSKPTSTPQPSSAPTAAPASQETKPSSEPEKSSEGVYKGSQTYSESQGMTINSETGKDQYKTDPVPSGKPVPVEPQSAVITDKKLSCTLSVRCDTILKNMQLLNKEKWELVPKDGVIYAAKTVTFYEGESVFNVLQREMKKAKIQMEFENTPMYNSAYIEGINNLYEFDVGELSGWLYKVNGWFPNYGCSRYKLKDGDVVEWLYTCDLGKDVGGYYAVGS